MIALGADHGGFYLKEAIKKYSKDFDGSLGDAEVMTLAGVSRKSYYKYKKELKGIDYKVSRRRDD